MEYRKLPKGTENISIIGLGNSSLGEAGEKEAQAAVELALENGVNFLTWPRATQGPFAAYGRAGCGLPRQGVLPGALWGGLPHWKYGWTLELEDIKRSVAWQLDALKNGLYRFWLSALH